MDVKETLASVTKRPEFIPAVVGMSTFIVGTGIGYIFGKRSVKVVKTAPVQQMSLFDYVNEQEFPMDEDNRVVINVVQEKELTDSKIQHVDYNAISTVAVDDAPVDTVEDSPEPVEDEPQLINVFAVKDEAWDMDFELKSRDESKPYIIHVDEFIENEFDFRQETVTYYAGDDVLADLLDKPVHRYDRVMGELKFGHGSKDPSIVYIRNKNLNIEWEVLRHSGSFATEVMGLEFEEITEAEIRHSNVVRKFRPD